MTAARLLRLYPRAWRDRYAEEFLEMAGPDTLQLQQVIDIVSGAIDAWLSADVRDATRVQPQGGVVMEKAIAICGRNQVRYTTRDGLIGAAVMLVSTLLTVMLGLAARRAGWTFAGDTLINTGYFVSMTLSMPFWLMKGQPRSAQAVIVGGTIVFLVLVNFLATLI